MKYCLPFIINLKQNKYGLTHLYSIALHRAILIHIRIYSMLYITTVGRGSGLIVA